MNFRSSCDNFPDICRDTALPCPDICRDTALPCTDICRDTALPCPYVLINSIIKESLPAKYRESQISANLPNQSATILL